MYYLMDWRVNERELGINLAEIDVTPATGVPWSMGLYCDKKVEQPICLEIDPDSGDAMPDAFLVGIPLFSEKLLAILNKEKVDNIQLYRVEIADKRTSKTFMNYMAVNIVGKVSCANLEKSRYIEGSGPPLMYFEKLVLNKGISNDYQIFRLAESSDIIINERLANQMMEQKLVGIRLLALESSD